MKKIMFSAAEKVIIRNQHLMMLTLANMCAKSGGLGATFFSEKLRDRIREMETNLDWIAAPSDRI